MVKLDYARDYYADLELSGPADAVEIKKQFKKLGGLGCHPRRCLVVLLTRYSPPSAQMAPRSQPRQGG